MKRRITYSMLAAIATFILASCSKSTGGSTPPPSNNYSLNYSIGDVKGNYTKKVFASKTKTQDDKDMIQIDCVGDNDNSDGFTVVVTGNNLGTGTFPFTYDNNSGPQETIWVAKETSATPTFWTYYTACDGSGWQANTGSITITSITATEIDGSFTGMISPYTTTCGPSFKTLSGTFKAKRIQ